MRCATVGVASQGPQCTVRFRSMSCESYKQTAQAFAGIAISNIHKTSNSVCIHVELNRPQGIVFPARHYYPACHYYQPRLDQELANGQGIMPRSIVAYIFFEFLIKMASTFCLENGLCPCRSVWKGQSNVPPDSQHRRKTTGSQAMSWGRSYCSKTHETIYTPAVLL